MAPNLPGNYLYTLCVRSDSYVDSDFFENLPVSFLNKTDHATFKTSVVISYLFVHLIVHGDSSAEPCDSDASRRRTTRPGGEQ